MLKMLMDPMGGIVMTNDGNAILREITVQHPAAKSMIEIARTQDEEVGDGTTSVIVLAGEILAVSEQFLQQQIHPTVIIRAYREALEDMVNVLQNDASILDWVLEDMRTLNRQLGRGDQSKIAEYLDSVREVERRIQNAEQRTADSPAPDMDRPRGVPEAYADHVRLMFDLQALALQADLTRIITFQMARETSNRTYPEIGVPDAHHPTTHHSNNPEKLEKLAKINTYHISLFAYFLHKLKSIPDGDGNLLDSSLLLCGSGMGNPDVHDHVDLPILVAGGGGGSHVGGRHIRYPEPTPLVNLHLTLLDKVGVSLDAFSDSSGKLKELYEPVSL